MPGAGITGSNGRDQVKISNCVFREYRFLTHFGPLRDVFQAIADPTRRQIINMISLQSLNVNSVAGNFDVSRTAIYKHVKILTECGLVVIKQKGRERFCEARLEKLHEVSDWVEQYRKFWNARLDALEDYLSEMQTKSKKSGKSK
jgi:DNA-binding transcriptional ArsR family regulator